MKPLVCEGCCADFGACYGVVRETVVSTIGEVQLCEGAVAGFEAAGIIVSYIYAPQYVGANNRQEPAEDVLRALGHFLK